MIKVGSKYIYQGRNTIQRSGKYIAEVVGIYSHVIVLSLTIIQRTIQHDGIWGEPKPYLWCICKSDIGITEHLNPYNELEVLI